MKQRDRTKMSLYFLPAVAVLTIVLFAGVSWYQERKARLPYFGAASTIEGSDGPHYTVPDFFFVNQDGMLLDAGFIKGKIWVVHYFFRACPSICPKLITSMKQVAAGCGNDDNLRMISLTVDPGDDTPAKLRSYAAAKDIDLARWQMGTGDKKDLYRFARKGLFITATDGDGGQDDFIHSDRLVLIDRNRHIRGYYEGTRPAEASRLIADIKKLESED